MLSVPTLPLPAADDATISTALHLLELSCRRTLESDNATLSEVPIFESDAAVADRVLMLVARMAAMHEAGTVDREQLETLFANAEEGSELCGQPTAATTLIYWLWDEVLEQLPDDEPDDYLGSSAEVSGDYGRLYRSRRTVSESNGH